MALELTSSAFISPELRESMAQQAAGSSSIPARFAMEAIPGGRNVSIPYVWTDAPAGTKSFALVLADTAPVAHGWVHWLVVGLPRDSRALAEGASLTTAMPYGAVELRNSFGFEGYGGPQPPAGTGTHTYVASLYALDVEKPAVARGASVNEVREAMSGHVLASASYTGTFGR